MDGRVRNGSDAVLLQPQHDFDIETFQRGLIETWRTIAKANNVDGRSRDPFEEWLRGDQSVEVVALGDILIDETSEFLDPCSLSAIQTFGAQNARLVCKP